MSMKYIDDLWTFVLSVASCASIYIWVYNERRVRVVKEHFVIVFLSKNKDEYMVKLNEVPSSWHFRVLMSALETLAFSNCGQIH